MRRIFAAKGRPADHPVIVHLHDAAQLARWARAVPDGARALAAAFWPGPLTLILPRARARLATSSPAARTASACACRRIRSRARCSRAFGGGIAAPSANRFGRISPTTARHVADDLGDAVALILDGGACAVGIESTIVAFAGDAPVLLRPGGDRRRAICRACSGTRCATPDGARAARVGHARLALRAADAGEPGRAPTRCARRSLQLDERDEIVAVLARTVARPAGFRRTSGSQAPADAAAYAHDLYANLRALDAANADVILIEAVPDGDAWLAVRDRLARATRGVDDDRD